GSMGKIFIGKNKVNLIKTKGPDPTIIDIGSPAIDRAASVGSRTAVAQDNPANATGIITSVELWFIGAATNVKVATFFLVSGNNLSTRDYEVIGNVSGGSKQIKAVNLEVHTGDFIGVYWEETYIELDTSGGNTWQGGADNDYIPCVNQLFTLSAGWVISLYGTGEAVVPVKDVARTGVYSFKTLK
ncbi:unnamed protein product, partial [marine sediment metagenome]